MRSVTTKPPTKLMVANMMAINPSNLSPVDDAKAVATSDPSIVTPDKAFIPDISGVCSKAGTSEITLYPAIVATAKISNSIKGLIQQYTPLCHRLGYLKYLRRYPAARLHLIVHIMDLELQNIQVPSPYYRQ